MATHEVKQILTADGNPVYADVAIRDKDGNEITETYATKEELESVSSSGTKLYKHVITIRSNSSTIVPITYTITAIIIDKADEFDDFPQVDMNWIAGWIQSGGSVISTFVEPMILGYDAQLLTTGTTTYYAFSGSTSSPVSTITIDDNYIFVGDEVEEL